MKFVVTLALTACLLVGCATKVYRKVPPPANQKEASEVVIIRNKSIWGSGGGIGIQIDGYKVASLSVGHHLRIQIDPGPHAVGTKSGSITLILESKTSYYFLTGIGVSGDENIERLDEADAQRWLAKSKEVLLEY